MSRTSKDSRKKYYYSHRESEIKRIKERKIALRKFFNDYKSKCKCKFCGENTPECLDFHHIDPNEKDGAITVLISNGYSKERILKEIKKCIVVCSNCHRKIHCGKLKV